MTDDRPENHRALFHISHDQLWTLLGAWLNKDEFCRPRVTWSGDFCSQKPFDWTGTKAIGVYQQPQRQALALVLEHPNFPITEPGDVLPECGRLEVELTTIEQEVEKEMKTSLFFQKPVPGSLGKLLTAALKSAAPIITFPTGLNLSEEDREKVRRIFEECRGGAMVRMPEATFIEPEAQLSAKTSSLGGVRKLELSILITDEDFRETPRVTLAAILHEVANLIIGHGGPLKLPCAFADIDMLGSVLLREAPPLIPAEERERRDLAFAALKNWPVQNLRILVEHGGLAAPSVYPAPLVCDSFKSAGTSLGQAPNPKLWGANWAAPEDEDDEDAPLKTDEQLLQESLTRADYGAEFIAASQKRPPDPRTTHFCAVEKILRGQLFTVENGYARKAKPGDVPYGAAARDIKEIEMFTAEDIVTASTGPFLGSEFHILGAAPGPVGSAHDVMFDGKRMRVVITKIREGGGFYFREVTSEAEPKQPEPYHVPDFVKPFQTGPLAAQMARDVSVQVDPAAALDEIETQVSAKQSVAAWGDAEVAPRDQEREKFLLRDLWENPALSEIEKQAHCLELAQLCKKLRAPHLNCEQEAADMYERVSQHKDPTPPEPTWRDRSPLL